MRELIALHARGDALDAGSGLSPYRALLRQRCASVLSIDVEDRGEGIDLVADLQEMPAIDSASRDFVLCTQVLEHVPRPWDAVAEIARVLRPGGIAVLSMPHLSPIHEAPHDYYRYTRYGIDALCARSGLSVEVEESGGLLALLGHGASVAWLTTVGAVPGLRSVALALNSLVLVRLLGALDRLVGMRRVFPCNYVAVARRPATAEER